MIKIAIKIYTGFGNELQIGKIAIFVTMNNLDINNQIKSIVHSFLPDAQVLLYGSRAKGLAHKDSDYDLLIITDKIFTPKEKINCQSKIRKALVWSLDVPFDVIVKEPDEIERYKNAKGHIIYYALREAVTI